MSQAPVGAHDDVARLQEAARLQNEREAELTRLLASGDPAALKLIGQKVDPLKYLTRRVSKELFDQVVDENVQEFGMEYNEAVKDAISQFTTKGFEVDPDFYATEA